MTELKTESKFVESHKTPKRLDLQGFSLPPEEFLALPEEVTPEMKDNLISSLISYAGKLDAPARFTTALEAYRYFKIFSDTQIDRLNKAAEKIRKRVTPPETPEPKLRTETKTTNVV